MISDEPQALTVMYFFHVNGRFACTRDGVRALSMDPFERYAYYAKIEINFPHTTSLAAEKGREVSLAALGPLLERLLPALYEEHFDLERFKVARPDGSTGS